MNICIYRKVYQPELQDRKCLDRKVFSVCVEFGVFFFHFLILKRSNSEKVFELPVFLSVE